MLSPGCASHGLLGWGIPGPCRAGAVAVVRSPIRACMVASVSPIAGVEAESTVLKKERRRSGNVHIPWPMLSPGCASHGLLGWGILGPCRAGAVAVVRSPTRACMVASVCLFYRKSTRACC